MLRVDVPVGMWRRVGEVAVADLALGVAAEAAAAAAGSMRGPCGAWRRRNIFSIAEVTVEVRGRRKS